MARRRAAREGSGKAPRGARHVRKSGRSFPWWAQVAVVVISVVALIYAINAFRPEDDDGEPVAPEHFIREADFTATLDPGVLFVLEGRNASFTLEVENTGDVYCDFELEVSGASSLGFDHPDAFSIDANRSRKIEVLVTAGNVTGNRSVTIALAMVGANTTWVEWNGTGTNVTEGNETIEVLRTNMTIEASVWVSRYDLRFEALTPNVEAGPGENVTVVLEVENTGTLEEWVGIGVTRFLVHGNESEWDEPELDITGSIRLMAGDLTHVRLNLSVPEMANPEGDHVRMLVEGHSLTAEDLDIPLFHKVWVRVNVSAYGIRAEPDEYIKDVMPGRWVNFTISVFNFGGSQVNIKYFLDTIPQTWEYDVDIPPDEGWPLTVGRPITFRIGLSPAEDQLDTDLTLSIDVYAVGEEAESLVKITARVRNPSFAFFAPDKYLQVDLDRINWGVANNRTVFQSFPMAVFNEGFLEYELHLEVTAPGGWLARTEPSIAFMESEAIVEFTLDLWLPVNTSVNEYPLILKGSAEGVEDSIDFVAVVPPYLNGTHDLAGKPAEFQLPHMTNGTSNGTFHIHVTNTGNHHGVFEVSIENWQEIEGYRNWSVMLDHGDNSSAKKISLDIAQGATEQVEVNIETTHDRDPAQIVARIHVSVVREDIWVMEPIHLLITVGS